MKVRIKKVPKHFKAEEGVNIPKENKYLPYVNAAGDILQGLSMIKGQNYAVDYANQMSQLTNIQAQSMNTEEDPYRRSYVRPEDVVLQPNQMFPSYGTGSNILSAKDGAELKKYQNGGDEEFLNPDYFGEENGYISLPTTTPYVQKKKRNIGDILNSGQFGNFMNNKGGTQILESINPYIGHVPGSMPTAGNKIGGGIGMAAGTFFGGPIGGAIGKFAGNLVGGAIDQSDNKIRRYENQSQDNINNILGNYVGMDIRSKNRAFMENGGNMAIGGQLQVYEDGGIETISNNPYLDSDTVEFRGASHDDGGMPITYGNSPVEVEGGEPATKIDDNLVVFGNLKIPNEFLPEIGDSLAKGKKFKNYIKDLSKIEAKQNKIVNKSIDEVNNLTPITSFDKLKMTSLQANLLGANMKLKDIAQKKEKTAMVQKAINDTAEEFNLDADHLARGKYKKAKNGMYITAQAGIQLSDATKAMYPSVPNPDYYGTIAPGANMSRKDYIYYDNLYKTDIKRFQREMAKNYPDIVKGALSKYDVSNYGKANNMSNLNPLSNNDSLPGKRTTQTHTDMNPYGVPLRGLKIPFHPQTPTFDRYSENYPMEFPKQTSWSPKALEKETDNKFPWMDIVNQTLPYLRPSNDEYLDPNQLMGEIYALSNNQLEPVDAQGYHPQLSTPYDISLQDILNANQSDFNSIQRQLINNPAAISALAGQKYDANSKTLGEQMRINQGEKQRVYEGNRNLLNDAKLKNLQIYDQQYVRQAQAKTNTKAVTQSALNSISSKIAQNKLENKTLQTYENLYNYRYDRSGRAINMNPLQDFEAMIANASPEQLDEIKQKIMKTQTSVIKKDGSGNPIGTTDTLSVKTSPKGRNGSIVKAAKNL